jgi:hypothetical protein
LEQNVDHQQVWAIPKLRRVIKITDFDSGEPIVSDGCRDGFQINVSFLLTVPVQGDTDQRQVMALRRRTAESEKQTHRKLSGSVDLGQFSTQSGH